MRVDSHGAIGKVKVRTFGTDSGDARLTSCVSDALPSLALSGLEADVLRGRDLDFTLALEAHTETSARATIITVAGGDLRLGEKLIASELRWGRPDLVQRAAWKTLAAKAGATARLELRGTPETDSGAIVAGLLFMPDGPSPRSLRFARKLADGTWRTVNVLGTVRQRDLCRSSVSRALVVQIDAKGFHVLGRRVRASRVTERTDVPLRDGTTFDLIGLARALRSMRRDVLPGRSDMTLAISGGVPYDVFAKTLEIAAEIGFFDADVLTQSQL